MHPTTYLVGCVIQKRNRITTFISSQKNRRKLQGTFSHLFSDPTKYFGCELGAQTQFDFKNDRYIVNGSHDAPKLQDMLDGFIRKFVLCENCDNPETDIKVNAKKQTLGASCKACGHSFPLDMRHKLATFILRVCN